MQGALDWGGVAAGPEVLNPRLQAADPAQWPVQADWAALVYGFWASAAGQSLQAFLQQRLDSGAIIYPPQPLRALALTPLADVRVVILGQDPYHGPGQAEGLAFSVAPGVRIPPSLRNMFKELQRDLGLAPPASGSLVRWAGQGVLLLNTCLTVEDGQPASHAGRGWEVLTDALIRRCSETGGPKLFLLWGAHAQKKAALIDGAHHQVLCANHPSPLSASRGPAPFLGCGHFGAVNHWLQASGQAPVAW
ncbi:MAG TPA: uracil-DNA glycosylase [Hydrogenophaga sp.]|uniref:uracil-DNA glycosylase n=1 Tax=Hydrogenophaga sp. TaxID=1904254 RepID=UPI0008D5C70F|nr:uracil-DNA glycosylase [Hydrogenophaga sp.]MBU4183925.1 uracil-DNA glycosylase [Gammaproteobacteria bacterium]OGA74187.1 MAG: uracil-DNA glycosylase [Burkholderiales bacterium GWE1_65_30]OGA89542.1 MAG: uracil-DNA glycosylase [Burkholderiales bacterium GWF1_66_17]MBU4279586.1 uracil-DNA glycosylase [Gammaproteobacteria bacterium]MBU4508542.1 uracil-DNA glycosylase [Gammaproteobacteria bacterium]